LKEDIRAEILRKLIHLSVVVVPLGYLFINKELLLLILSLLLVVAVSIEAARSVSEKFSDLFIKIVGRMLRKHENKRLTGATYLIFGSFLTILIFNKWIAITALFFVIISDALAAVVGTMFGRHTIYGNRTVEGSAVFVAASLIIILMINKVPFFVGLSGMVIALVLEVFVKRVNDNLMIPLSSGLVMQSLMMITKQL